jgi:DNA-binding PadR family transcriptional regulator
MGSTPPRKVTNPLGLAVLAWLLKEPLHPYALGRRLRETGQDRRIKYNHGTLYLVFEQLERAGFVRVDAHEREGGRPERAIYAITDAGRAEFREWLCALVAEPRDEFPQFLVALSFISLLPPPDAVELLAERRATLERTADETRGALRQAQAAGHPWVFLVEEEFAVRMFEVEIRFVTDLVGRLSDPDYIKAWQETVGSWI